MWGVETHSCAEAEYRGRWDGTRTGIRKIGCRRDEDSDTAGRLDVWRPEGLKMRQLLLPPRISSNAGASRSLRHKGTVAARLKRRKELKGTKKITEESRGKREGGERGVEMCERTGGMKSDQGFRERVSFSFSLSRDCSPPPKSSDTLNSPTAQSRSVDPVLDSLIGFRPIAANFLIEPAFHSSPHAYYYHDNGAIAVFLVIW